MNRTLTLLGTTAALLALAACSAPATRSDTAATTHAKAAAGAETTAATLDPQDRNAFFVHFARTGDVAAVERELAAGIDINVRDNLGQTALIAAVSHSLLPVVNVLLQHHADANAADNSGWAPLHYAAYFGAGSEVMDALVAGGADVNLRNDRGITPLYFATAAAHDVQVASLLAHGADREIASNAGFTPLRLANTKGFTAIAALLAPAASSSAPPPAEGTR